jgi:hypothetical protein
MRKTIILSVLALVIIAVAYFVAPHVQAAAAPTAVPVESCEPWRTAGNALIWKCVDTDPPWATCYSQTNGLLFCVME